MLSGPYASLPEAEYYARLRALAPELGRLAATLDDQSAVLRKEMTATLGELVGRAFGEGE